MFALILLTIATGAMGASEKSFDCDSGLSPAAVEFVPGSWIQKWYSRIYGKVVVTDSNGRQVVFNRTDRNHETALMQLPDHLLDFNSLRGKRVLDVGSGGGSLVREMRRAGIEADGLDIYLSPQQSREDYFFQGDFRSALLPDAEYDVIYMLWSLLSYELKTENFEPRSVERTFSQLARLLKVGGKARISPLPPRVRLQNHAEGIEVIHSSTRYRFVVPGFRLTESKRIGSGRLEFYAEIEKLPLSQAR